ncbi:PREDICTED: glutathione S-transferase 1-1-like [Nicrophorus vespilloides]|uniref:Glutathione S-transferase 1-1-like n=1 Tax=Nicrophorus vespilloides TaxID=110193 RepID=A0ABM1M413_NICVS|nr:PREDICTED: glutathione S-transferase 1-1-like [Nicrophorus vespilloides]
MAPKLYTTDLSPPARGVVLTEKALGIKLDHVHLDLMNGDHVKPEFIKMNPQHTIPTLVEDDGSVIWDSHAIMTYLVDKYGKDDSLYPKDLIKRAAVDQRLHFESGNMFSLLRRIVIGFKLGAKCVDPHCVDLVNEQYAFLDAFVDGHKWMVGDDLTVADFSLISSLTSMATIVPVDAKYKNLWGWMKRCEDLPYYEINKKGTQDFKAYWTKFKNA